eukprot:scaffold80139_cov33-Tisochrysis_lutea.AAC.2
MATAATRAASNNPSQRFCKQAIDVSEVQEAAGRGVFRRAATKLRKSMSRSASATHLDVCTATDEYLESLGRVACGSSVARCAQSFVTRVGWCTIDEHRLGSLGGIRPASHLQRWHSKLAPHVR